jgi:hypothetical protein
MEKLMNKDLTKEQREHYEAKLERLKSMQEQKGIKE